MVVGWVVRLPGGGLRGESLELKGRQCQATEVVGVGHRQAGIQDARLQDESARACVSTHTWLCLYVRFCLHLCMCACVCTCVKHAIACEMGHGTACSCTHICVSSHAT